VKRSNRLILLIGVLLAVVAFVGIIFVFNNQSGGTAQPIVMANVVVATKDIKLGEAVTDRQVETKQIPLADKKTDQYSDPGEIIGQVVRTDVTSGAIMTQAMFVGTGSPNLSKDLPAGLVAIAIRVDAVTGVGTLINVGDRIDILATVPFKVEAGPAVPVESQAPGAATWIVTQDPGLSSKLIVQNVEVRGIVGTVPAATDGTTTTSDPLTTQQIVILAVTPQQAEVLENLGQVAAIKGFQGAVFNITLVLRSPKDKDAPPVETTGVVLQTLMEKYGVLPPLPFEITASPRP
jgi:Flp pilus assembly protein CpaB